MVKNVKINPGIPIPRPMPSWTLMLLACKLFETSCKLLSPVGAEVEELVRAFACSLDELELVAEAEELVLSFASALDEELAAEVGDAELDGDDVDGNSVSQTINESTVSGEQTQASNQGAVSGKPVGGGGPNRGQRLHRVLSSYTTGKISPLAACAQSRDS